MLGTTNLLLSLFSRINIQVIVLYSYLHTKVVLEMQCKKF